MILGASVALYWVVGHLWQPPVLHSPSGEAIAMSPQAQRAAGLLTAAILLWMTEAVPFAVTAILALIMAPILGITEGLLSGDGPSGIHGVGQGLDVVLRWGFGNRILLFFLGVFLITAAIQSSDLGRRMALGLLLLIGPSPPRVLMAFLLGGTILSMWITDMAVSALLLPIGMQLLERAGMRPKESSFGKALMISCSWGATFGGIGTPAGCGPNPIAMAFLVDLAGVRIGFLDWMKLGVPSALVLAPLGWIVLMLLFPPETQRLRFTREDLWAEMRAMGPMGAKEKRTLSVFLAVVLLWVLGDSLRDAVGVALPMEWVSIAGGIVLFLPGLRVLSWKEAEGLVPWGAILLVLASLSIGMLTYRTGAARWMAWMVLGWIRDMNPSVQVAVVLAGVMAMKLFLASNTVSGVILIPLLIQLAKDLSLDPWFFVAPAAFSSSLGMVLVTQTPTHVIPYSSGYFTMGEFARAGAIMSIVMVVALTLTLMAAGAFWGVYRF